MHGSPEDRVLVVAPIGRDATLTADLLERNGVDALVCPNIGELCRRLEAEGAGALLLAEEGLTPTSLARLAEVLAAQPPWSDLPIVVFTGRREDFEKKQQVARLLETLGNVSLLDRPVRPATMTSAVQSALRARHRQYAGREALAAQERAIRQRDEFLAMLGHELRNPLGALQLALEMDGRGGEHVKYREVMARQAHHLARLVDDLLDVARVTSGKVALQMESLDFGRLVRRVVYSQEAAISAHGLRLDCAIASGLSVDGDSLRLEQVVSNLVTNAIKYTPAGGELRIELRGDDGFARLAVSDDGVGIAPEMLPRVFELFAQAPGTLDRSKGGLGIGLTMARSLIGLHGGTIEAHSPGLGKGSTFEVRVPLAEGVARPVPVARAAPVAGDARRILVIEDNPDTREMLSELLVELGHHVEVAGDGVQGIERAVGQRPEVCFIDIGLPGMDGYEVARHLRSWLGPDVLLVALTGYGQPDDRTRALASGFDAHFTKPVKVGAILDLLARRDRSAAS
jgi:signal transduction histidine kinase/ActR/RegA family two-component response regulator